MDVTGVQMTLQPPRDVRRPSEREGTAALSSLAGHRIQVQPLSRAIGVDGQRRKSPHYCHRRIHRERYRAGAIHPR